METRVGDPDIWQRIGPEAPVPPIVYFAVALSVIAILFGIFVLMKMHKASHPTVPPSAWPSPRPPRIIQ